VADKVDVVSEAVFNLGSQVQEETSIKPDSEDVHELKGVEFVTQRVSGGVARGSGVGVSNAEARVKQGVGVVQSQGGVGVRSKTSPAVEEQQYIDPSILRSQLNEDEKVMMREILDATIVPMKEAVVSTNREIKELTGAIKTLVGAAGTPDGGGGDPDDDPRRPKRVPGKDRGKPTSRKKGKHRDDDPSSSSSSSSEESSDSSGRDKRRKSKLPDGPAKTIDLFNKKAKRRESIAPNDHLHPAKFPKSGGLEDMLVQIARPNMTEKMSMYTMKQELTEKELPPLVGTLDVHRVFLFLNRVADVERTNIYPVFIAKHISPTILTVLEHQIRTHRDDKFYAQYHKLKAAKTRHILYGGVQNLTNVEVFKVFRWEIRPLSKKAMMDVLRRSVYPAKYYE